MFATDSKNELVACLDQLTQEDVRSLADEELDAEFAALRVAARRVQAELLRRLGEVDRRGMFAADGHVSAGAWLVNRHQEAPGTAREEVRAARALPQMPATSQAFARGAVSFEAVRVLSAAREAHPESFARDEAGLVEMAKASSGRRLRDAIASWRNEVDSSEDVSDAERRWQQRYLHVYPTPAGMVRLDGELDRLTGETIITAIQAIVDAEIRRPADGDDRSPAQRRADALGTVCERWLDSSGTPSAGGERPNLVVTVSLEALIAAGAGRGGTDRSGRVDWDHTGPVDPETVQMIACDASVRRIVLDTCSEPVDIGRRTKVVPAGMRRAVGVRDRGCRFPGCDRPPGWTDAHHAIHWTRGGPTAVHNLVLLCRRHHRMIHWNRFSVVMERGQPVFRRADGSMLEAKDPRRREVAAVA